METSAQRDARCLIERIHREHTLNGAIIGTKFETLARNCLEILSGQLYQKSTHFLLELIQNADDNTFNCTNPTLNFSYDSRTLRIDCNEVGFTAENVEAICAVNKSTKSGKLNDGEYIGEKGIGFKSVFKAASVVWISSREFQFKFDTAEPLGIVAPVWADFPEPTQPGYTFIYLQLSEDYEEKTLIDELLTFDTHLLIFLRQIKEINIRIISNNSTAWGKRIWKEEKDHGADRVTILHTGESTFHYLIRTHVIHNLPKEEKRPNWSQTKLLLAFPIAELPEKPLLIPQNVYAFLPIRDYGLKFLVQGDFLLTASREDVESTLPWNNAIRNALAEAFLLAVDHFNQGELKYFWPYYLPSTPDSASSFFEPAVVSILTRLKNSPVLESCASTMAEPFTMQYVPTDQFVDSDGVPFTLSSDTAARYLSLNYPAWAMEATCSIGVSQLSSRDFLRDLVSMITQDPEYFRSRSELWQSQLADTLIKITTDTECLPLIQDICLIPLQDGTWTSARGKSIFFSKSEEALEIPAGIEVVVLDPTAEADPARRRLFTILGAKHWEASGVCRMILEMHESSDFDPNSLTLNELISHARFIYNSSWQPPKTANLWFATTQDARCLGRELYLFRSANIDSPEARIFAKLQGQFLILHDAYLEAFPPGPDWPAWLVRNLGLSLVPRLITPQVDVEPRPLMAQEDNKIHSPVSSVSSTALSRSSSVSSMPLEPIFALSEEFHFMFRECNSSDILQLLRDNWRHYSQWIDGEHIKWQKPGFLGSSTLIKQSLGAFKVQTAKGLLPLQETVLPMVDHLIDKLCPIPAVDVQDPRHEKWRVLRYFGVVVARDVEYYFRCLTSFSQEPKVDVNCVVYIYEQLQARYKENVVPIRAAFAERNIVLILAPPDEPGVPATWMNTIDCFAHKISIEKEYPSSSYLFRCLKDTDGDPITPLIDAATWITRATPVAQISRLLRDISAALNDVKVSEAAQLIQPLQDKQIFPVITVPGEREDEGLVSVQDQSWFIADQPGFQDSFRGKLPLLAFAIEDLSALQYLFRILRLDRRMLSKLAKKKASPKGRVGVNWQHTKSLRSKSPFIKILVPNSHAKRATILQQLDNLKVSVATAIHHTYMLRLADVEIDGNPVRGQVSLSHTGNSFDIHMTEECAKYKNPPHELIQLIADACEIKQPNHYALLCMALGGSGLDIIYSCFVSQGIYVKGLVFAPKRQHRQRTDNLSIPSPFSGKLGRGGISNAEATRPSRSQRSGIVQKRGSDRRLPMILFNDELMHSDIKKNDILEGWEEIQYLGEHLTSKVLEAYLGQDYDPEKYWTSELRSRYGHTPFVNSAPCAPFTIGGRKVVDQMTVFVTKYARSMVPNWKKKLRANTSTYHLDLAVSVESKTSPFAITSAQIERMRKFRMSDNPKTQNKDVVVLVRISNVVQHDLVSFDVFVDPWRLFDCNQLSFEHGWIFRGALNEKCKLMDKIEETNTGHRRGWRKLHIPTGSSAVSGTQDLLAPIRNSIDTRVYTHRTLGAGDIRLLYLLPGDPDDRLQGVITHVPYNNAGSYRTLSYVWGTDPRKEYILTSDGLLPVTISLARALRGLRGRRRAITLWVDAVCINQKDNNEKVQQIRLLAKIFQTAASTYAYIDSCAGSDEAFETLMQVRAKAACERKESSEAASSDEDSEWESDAEETTNADGLRSQDFLGAGNWPKGLASIPASWNEMCIPPFNDTIWSSVRAVFSHSWFRRVWIIQEIVAARNVKIVCGKWVLDWSDVHLAMETIDREVQLFTVDVSRLRTSWEPFLTLARQREWEIRNYRWSLLMLLENFRHAKSTLGRDHFFALLGLASDGNEPEFEPDYDAPLEWVVLKFASVFVRQGRGMQMLYRAGLNRESHRFPSWIPDWTVELPSSLHDYCDSGVIFAASGSEKASIRSIPHTDELSAEGFFVDAIESMSDSSNIEHEWTKYFTEVDTMVDSAFPNTLWELREDLKWKVPIAGVLHPKTAIEVLDLKSSYMALRSHINGSSTTKVSGGYESSCGSSHYRTHRHVVANAFPEQSMGYIAGLHGALRGWRFVVTNLGFVGVVPNMTLPGDAVVILKGGVVPFILRKSTLKPGAFRLVGQCYIHNMMSGKGVSQPELVEQTFRLH